MRTIVHVSLPEEMPLVRRLFEEYAASIGIDLCFQNFDREIETLPGAYAPPDGTIVVAYVGGEPAGCAALRKIGDGVCEMKRLYVRPAHRGEGIGRALAEEIVSRAREIGYKTMRLDTLESMTEANALYLSIGFGKCSPYCYNPCEHPVYMELPLV